MFVLYQEVSMGEMRQHWKYGTVEVLKINQILAQIRTDDDSEFWIPLIDLTKPTDHTIVRKRSKKKKKVVHKKDTQADDLLITPARQDAVEPEVFEEQEDLDEEHEEKGLAEEA